VWRSEGPDATEQPEQSAREKASYNDALITFGPATKPNARPEQINVKGQVNYCDAPGWE